MSYEEKYGKHMGAERAPKAGQVVSVSANRMKVKYDDGEAAEIQLYDNYPLNRKTLATQTPVVKAGERFGANQLLARSNFTDEKGATALGLNMRIAYMPLAGYNFDASFRHSERAVR